MAPICLTSPITCAVEEQPKATSPKASDAPTSSVPEPLAAHASGSTPIDTQQQSAQDLISDLAASEAVMQDGLATAVGSLTGSASKAQQAAAASYSMDADIGDVSPPSSVPDGGMIEGADLSDAAAQDLAAAAEEAAHAATPLAADESDESPDASRTAEAAPQEFLTSDPADSGLISPPSSRPDGADLLPSDDGLSDAAAEDLAAAAEEAAHSAADAEISGTRVSALQRFMLSNIPNGNCLLEDNKSDAVAEDLAAAADAAARTSASSSELQTDALSSDTEQGAEERIGSMSAESSSSSVSPPLELQTSIVSDLSEIQLLRSQVCILHTVSLFMSVCLSVCLSGCLSFCLYLCLSVPLSICMFACLSALQALCSCCLTNSSMSGM